MHFIKYYADQIFLPPSLFDNNLELGIVSNYLSFLYQNGSKNEVLEFF